MVRLLATGGDLLTRAVSRARGRHEPAASRPPRYRPSRVGEQACDIRGSDLSGASVELVAADPVADRRALLFLTSSCGACMQLWDRAEPIPRLAVVVPDRATESIRTLTRLAPGDLELVLASSAWFDYEVPGAPWLVVVESGLVVSESAPVSWDDVAEVFTARGG